MAAAVIQRQPDIQYHPDYEKYVDRTKRRLESETLSKSLPPGLPEQLSSPFVWDGQDIQGRDDWVVVLSDSDVEEIDQALKHFKGNTHTHTKPLVHADPIQLTVPLIISTG